MNLRLGAKRTLVLLALPALGLLVWSAWPTPEVAVGRPIAAGDARALTASPTGDALSWLSDCTRAGSDWVGCDVIAYQLAEAKLVRVGSGAATSRPPRWSDAGELAVLVQLDADGATGELRVWSAAGGADGVDDHVSTFGFSGDGSLLYAADGVGYVRRADVATTRMRTTAALESLEPTPSMASPVIALALTGGRDLLSVHASGVTQVLTEDVYSYSFSASGRFAVALTSPPTQSLLVFSLDGTGGSVLLGDGVQSFSVAPVADAVAFTVAKGGSRVLSVARLDEASAPVQLAEGTELQYRWASKAPVLAWLTGRPRTLGVARPGDVPRTIASDVLDFELSTDGSRIAFTKDASTFGEGYRALYVARESESSPALVVSPTGGTFAFTLDGTGILYRDRALDHRGGRYSRLYVSCEPHPGGRMATDRQAGVHSIDGLAARFVVAPYPDDGVVRAIAEAHGQELVAYSGYRNFLVDVFGDIESVTFVPPDSRRVAYVVREPGRAGVFVADLGSWGFRCTRDGISRQAP